MLKNFARSAMAGELELGPELGAGAFATVHEVAMARCGAASAPFGAEAAPHRAKNVGCIVSTIPLARLRSNRSREATRMDLGVPPQAPAAR